MKHRDLIRAGLLVPAGNMALEYELPRWLPETIALNVARVWRPGGTTLSASALEAMQQNIAPALSQMDRLPLKVALFGCTSGSFVGQPDAPEAIERHITATLGVPAVTTAHAVIRALRALRAKRIFMITPYPDDINLAEVAFLRRYGIETAGYQSFNCSSAYPIAAVDSDDIVALAGKYAGAIGRTDALFISCTNLLTLEIIPALEETLGVPVVTSNQASLWALLQALDVKSRRAAGRLLSVNE
ncbi:aspartate/glutamate racemase family protein [Superficieibacter sp. 1612_C1]|uniref:maleate cis-trans isomerase family protein n=1 Tax=Superficieibacter sp. 1612_C1 TaxID=2780382 RepID=UPI0018833FDF|nr:aspartate/glutamate racemase family protein [Superficieibacter sp. 1612_C1]